MSNSLKVAVVDDDRELRELLCTVFKSEGKETCSYASGNEFLKSYVAPETSAPGLVVLDIQMPGLTGFDVLHQARGTQNFSKTIFVAITGALKPADKAWMDYVGFDYVVWKSDYNFWEKIRAIVQKGEIDITDVSTRYAHLSAAVGELLRLRMRTIELEESYIKRLVSEEVFYALDAGKTLTPKHAGIAVGFADIRGFVELVNRLQIHQVDSVLSLFFQHATNHIRSGGFLDKFIGDAVMWFHEVGSLEENCKSCIESGIGMVSKIEKLHNEIQEKLHLKLKVQIGIGIACGDALVGIFGTSRRIQYSALGPPVNLAARLCADAPRNGILIGGEAINHCAHATKRIGFRKIKGFDHKIEVRRISLPKSGPRLGV